MKKYLALTRPDHWFKNVFALPGVAFASLLAHIPFDLFVRRLVIGMASLCLIASANYVINEWLDAAYDRFHPIKRNRPSVVERLDPWIVYAEYLAILLAGPDPSFIASIFRPAAAERAEQDWQWWQHRFTALSTRSLFVVVPQSDHMIQLRQPAYVIAAIVRTLEAARAERGVQG